MNRNDKHDARNTVDVVALFSAWMATKDVATKDDIREVKGDIREVKDTIGKLSDKVDKLADKVDKLADTTATLSADVKVVRTNVKWIMLIGGAAISGGLSLVWWLVLHLPELTAFLQQLEKLN